MENDKKEKKSAANIPKLIPNKKAHLEKRVVSIPAGFNFDTMTIADNFD